jgi:hypothetical protein
MKNMNKLEEIEKQMKIEYNQVENEKNQCLNRYLALKKEEEVLIYNISFFENYLQKLNELEKEDKQNILELPKKSLNSDNNIQNEEEINTKGKNNTIKNNTLNSENII